MEVICPIPRDGNLTPLIKLGLREFYFGFLPLYWRNKYSGINSINRRYSKKEQFLSKKLLMKLIKKYRQEGIKFYIVFNAQLYTTEQIESIVTTIRDFRENGLSGVIAADIGLITRVKKELPDCKIHISCLAVCLNSESVAFFRELGADRVIFPRSISLRALEIIRKNNPDIELEVILTTKDCMNIDGFCTHHHCSDQLQPCSEEKNYLKEEESIETEDDNYSRIPHLARMGIDYLKFPRRGDTALELVRKNRKVLALIRNMTATIHK